MQELQLTVKCTPHGLRLSGPDLNRATYLPVLNGQHSTTKSRLPGELVWQSPELDIFVLPLVDGVEVQIRIHGRKSSSATAAARAA